MTSRERVLKALAHQEPDRVPYSLRPSNTMTKRPQELAWGPGVEFEDVFKNDVRYVYLRLPKRPEEVPENEWVPRPTAEDIAKCTEQTKSLKERGLFSCGYYACGVFEQAKHWFGDAQTLIMPYEEPARFERELDKITEWKIDVYSAWAHGGVDMLLIGDDLGSQRTLIMSPEQYRRWYRPRHARIVEHLKKIRADMYIAFHCCGFVTTLIPDLIQVGIDILQAVQPECMDLAQLKREFGKDLSFWGAVGTQTVLAESNPGRIIEGIRKTLAIMAPGGGYLASPCEAITDDVPWESILAFYEAMDLYGAYPVETPSSSRRTRQTRRRRTCPRA